MAPSFTPPLCQINPLKQTHDAPSGRIAAGLVRLDRLQGAHMQSLSNIGANSQQERWQILAVWEESIAAEDLQLSCPPSRHQCSACPHVCERFEMVFLAV